MVYRRKDSEKTSHWRKWLRQNEEFLNECGLPEIIFSTESHWQDFLEHGFLDHHADVSNFTIDELTEEKLRILQNFLESELTPDEKRWAIVLRQIESSLNDFAR